MIKNFNDFITEMAKIDKNKTKLTVGDKPLKSLPLEQIEDNMIMYREKEGNMLFAKGTVMVWFVDDSDLMPEFQNWDNLVLFPMPIAFRNAPIDDIWKKNTPIQKHIIGCIRAFVTDTQLYIDMMSVRKGYMKNGINSLMIKALVKDFPDRQLKFSKPTEMGKKYISKYHPTSKVEGQLSDEDVADLSNKLRNDEPHNDYSTNDIRALIKHLNVDTSSSSEIYSNRQRYEAEKEALVKHIKGIK